ncbi:zinc finger C3HC-type protein 1-like isoform X3 [Biomphalaria glabrata]|nr:zinc finger C3HC-type protein 1-like isoform X3 [Biomphalaria glabrata]
MLRCVGCKTFLSGQLPNKSDYLAFQESYNRLKKSLISAHDKFCIVAANPCPEHFCHVPVEDPTLLMVGFTERVKALMVVQDKLPCIALSKLQSLGYDEGQAGAYCKRNLLPDYDSTAQVVTLAFAGWTCCLSKKDVLQCCMCLRQIGIWNYLPMSHCSYSSEHVTEHEDQEGEPTVKKRKIAKAFDPIEEHNHWCPWIQPSSLPVLAMATNESGQTNPHSYLAWIAAIKVIAPGLMDKNAGLACSMKTSPMVEGLRCFRKVIKSWSSKKSGHQPFLQSTEQL